MENKVKVYKRVFDRDVLTECTLDQFIKGEYEGHPTKEMLDMIKSLTDKQARNVVKRSILPAADLSDTEYLCIDIDNLDGRNKMEIVNKLAKYGCVYMVTESVSGNLAAFIRWDRYLKDKFHLVYYKLWLELTLALQIHIDFLPEPDRLRYASNGNILYKNEECRAYNEFIQTDGIPYISTSGGGAQNENKTFGSK